MGEQDERGGYGRFLWPDYTYLLAKADREIASLRDKLDRDTVFNMLVTVDHITDWIEHDDRVQALAAGVGVEDIRKLESWKAIHSLCNGAKHLTLTRPRNPSRVRHSSKSWASRPLSSVRRSWRVALDYSETMYTVSVNDEWRDILDLAVEVVQAWREFLASHDLPTG